MRRWILYFIIFIVVAITNVPGFHGTDVGQLLPVEAVRLSSMNGMVILETDTGDSGIGVDVEAAIRDLKATTSGNVFLETADYLIVEPGCEDLMVQIQLHVHPSCDVCAEERKTDLEETVKFLSVHKPGVTLQEWIGGSAEMPTLTVEGGKMKLVR